MKWKQENAVRSRSIRGLIGIALCVILASCSSMPSVPSVGGGGEVRDGKYVQSGVKYVPLNQFHNACSQGNIFAVNKMLEDDPKLVNLHDDQYGESPLGWACRGRHYQVIRVLLTYDARTDSRNYDGLTPLTIATATDDASLVVLLVNHGANVNYADGLGRTPIHWAAGRGQIKIIQYLKDRGGKINVRDDDGLTPLDWAVNNRHAAAADYLRGIGAEPGEPVQKEEVDAEKTEADPAAPAATQGEQ